MSGASRVFFGIALVVLLVGLAFAAYYFSGFMDDTAALSAAVNALETEKAQLAADVVNLEGWNSYQSTQIGAQQLVLRDLSATAGMGSIGIGSTPTFTLTPWDQVYGVMIEEDKCCVGGTAGETKDVYVQFLPERTDLAEPAVEMRVITGVANVYPGDMVNIPWEPVVGERVYPVYIAINWVTFWVHVQYRTAAGTVSSIYSDEIGVEGMPEMTEIP